MNTEAELKLFLEQEKQINDLRNEEYKKLKHLMIEYCGFIGRETQWETCYISLWRLNSFIEDFESKTIQSQGKQKENATAHLKTLYEIQQQYGKFYFESIIYRSKVSELERNQFKFLERIKELEKENTILKKQLEF
jgi:hypothetical protein